MKTLTKILGMSVLALTFAGCAPDPTIAMRDGSLENSNYEVKRVAVFTDNLAYQHRRGIYEITDKRDGKTYIGISGIGISEKAVHSAGKSSAQDER